MTETWVLVNVALAVVLVSLGGWMTGARTEGRYHRAGGLGVAFVLLAYVAAIALGGAVRTLAFVLFAAFAWGVALRGRGDTGSTLPPEKAWIVAAVFAAGSIAAALAPVDVLAAAGLLGVLALGLMRPVLHIPIVVALTRRVRPRS